MKKKVIYTLPFFKHDELIRTAIPFAISAM